MKSMIDWIVDLSRKINMMFERDFTESIDDEILQKHKTLLKELSMDSSVVCVCKDNESNHYYLMECCDQYFTYTLSKDVCMELSELFKEIADKY